jgi:hypothetical protein
MEQKGGNYMLNWNIEPRHWTAQQAYITGDILLDLIAQGWNIDQIELAPSGRARLYLCTLEHDGESISLRVLDCPAVQEILAELIAPLDVQRQVEQSTLIYA